MVAGAVDSAQIYSGQNTVSFFNNPHESLLHKQSCTTELMLQEKLPLSCAGAPNRDWLRVALER